MAEGKQVDVIYTDMSKVFDKLDWLTLLLKLSKLGLPGNILSLIKSYLSNRKNFVFVNGRKSYPFSPTSGVPQRSNLGPLLFNIFINDLPLLLSCYTLMYADDVKLYLAVKSTNDCAFLQRNIDIFTQWCHQNKLKVNAAKCKIMSFHRTKNPIIHQYFINNVLLQRTESFVDLGVTFDHKLNFDNHIEFTVKSAMRALGFVLHLAKDFCHVDTAKLLYHALVLLKLEYSQIVFPPRNKKQALK